MWDTFSCATAKKLTHFIILIAVLENVLPDAGLQKRATFSTLNIGVAGTGNQTRAACLASSGTIRSAIHCASPPPHIPAMHNRIFFIMTHSRHIESNVCNQKNILALMHLTLLTTTENAQPLETNNNACFFGKPVMAAPTTATN
jgi:hypothetical protein